MLIPAESSSGNGPRSNVRPTETLVQCRSQRTFLWAKHTEALQFLLHFVGDEHQPLWELGVELGVTELGVRARGQVFL